jgi:transcriptional regulator with XRE-family HTH domain
MEAKEIAEALGVSKSYISKLEKERQEIPIHIYKKWITVLGIK